jgi:predicted Rossmann-fold nucleotide-binding protein
MLKCLVQNKKVQLTNENRMQNRNEIGTVVVYCSSSEKIDKKYFVAAKELGETLAQG